MIAEKFKTNYTPEPESLITLLWNSPFDEYNSYYGIKVGRLYFGVMVFTKPSETPKGKRSS